jgi:hypothetical protein
MANPGTLNIVCHGTIAFVVSDGGSIELLIPEVNAVWDHDYQTGNWAGNLNSIEPGKVYSLDGVQNGDGRQRFDPKTNVVLDNGTPLAGFRRKLVVPPPKRISGANYVPVSPAQTFRHPNDPRVASITRMSLLNVLSYDCPDLDSLSLLAHTGDALQWTPTVVTDGSVTAVNLHIFAEPSTFAPLEKAPAAPVQEAPFNTLVNNLDGAQGLEMLASQPSTGSFAADIDPGDPIPGLPEPEKLALSQHVKYQRYGMLHNVEKPINCSGVVVQRGASGALAVAAPLAGAVSPAPPKAFAILRSNPPKVLKQPRVVTIYWGSDKVDSQVDAKVQQMLQLDFVKSALAEYGVAPPQYVKSVPNPLGSKAHIQDAHESPATTTGSAIAQGLADLIRAGKIPDPGDDSELLYMIVAPPGAVSDSPGVSGSHNYFYLVSTNGQRVPVHYAWALQSQTGGNGLTPLDNLTWTISHELLEACTDPEPPSGYVFQGPEICDIAAGLHGTEQGIVLTSYYSYRDRAFKTPPGSQAPLAPAGAVDAGHSAAA